MENKHYETAGSVVYDFRSRMIDGMKIAFDVLMASYGPKEGLVCIAGGESRVSLDDGLRALERLTHPDPVVREGIYFVKEAARMQHLIYGDGTSTCGMLAAQLCILFDSLSPKKWDSTQKWDRESLLNKMSIEAADLVSNLKRMSKPATESDLFRVAMTASHGRKELAEPISEAISNGGKNAVITAKIDPYASSISCAYRDGVVIPSGIIDRSMMANGPIMWDNAMFLMVNDTLSKIDTNQWVTVFNIMEKTKKPLVLFCKSADGSVAATFSRHSGKMAIVRIPVDWTYEQMKSVAIATGSKCFDAARGVLFSTMKPEDIGHVEDVRINADSMSFLKDTRASEAIEFINNSELGKEVKDAALSVMSGVSLTISFPPMSDGDFSHINEVLEDTVRATKCATDGVIPGGRTLHNLSKGMVIEEAIMNVQNEIPNDGDVLDPLIVVSGAIDIAIKALKSFAKTEIVIVSV